MTEKILAGLTMALMPAVAAAAEGGGDNNPFAGDVGTALWTLIIFLLVIFVLGKYAWGPVLSGLQGREEFIRDSLEQARQDRESAEQRLKEYEERLAQARADASEIVEQGRRDAEEVKRKIEAEARAEGDRMVARAKREIQIAKETAIKELYTASADLATRVAARVIRREISDTDHERLIADAIEELEQLERN